MPNDDEIEFTDEDDSAIRQADVATFSQAVLYSTDWTVETLVNQLKRENIDMNPRFQRRDAWNLKAKSRFIESIILGLPIPQIVLSELPQRRGKFIVIDGKQRLLTLMQFAGIADEVPAGNNVADFNSFALSGLEARADLVGIRYQDLVGDAQRNDDLNAFLNHTIRTVVIRNSPGRNFLHLVFLRLNTGSVKLSPQELRQAMVPGDFSNFIDDQALASQQVKALLSRDAPDPRMRDVEILARFVAFQNRLASYGGRMKEFLDQSAAEFNANWATKSAKIQQDIGRFNDAVDALAEIFGQNKIARKKGSRTFNRAIFDALALYAADDQIRAAMLAHKAEVVAAYNEVLENENFAEAIESDTAGIPHTLDRLRLWGDRLRAVTQLNFPLPEGVDDNGTKRIAFDQV